MQSSYNLQYFLYLSSDKKYLIGTNFKIPTKYIKYWYQESTPLSLIQNRIVFVLVKKASLNHLIDSNGCFFVDGVMPVDLHQELLHLQHPESKSFPITTPLQTTHSEKKTDSNNSDFQKKAMVSGLGILSTILILGIICDSNSRSRYY